MDLGLEGRSAIVCASSAGLGLACADALVREGVHVTVNGRDPDRLAEAVEALRAIGGGEVRGVAADIDTAEGRAALLADRDAPDILVTNNAGPRPGTFDTVSEEDLERALTSHFWTPIRLLRAVAPGMRERRFGRIVNITSAMVAAPNPMMIASTGARTGLTAVMKAASRELAPFNVLVNQILPERIDTGRQREMAILDAERFGITYEQARERQAASIAAGRHGRPDEVGAACAFLCAGRFGFISGMNLRLDGGSYPGLI